jgi:hypothetical protein
MSRAEQPLAVPEEQGARNVGADQAESRRVSGCPGNPAFRILSRLPRKLLIGDAAQRLASGRHGSPQARHQRNHSTSVVVGDEIAHYPAVGSCGRTSFYGNSVQRCKVIQLNPEMLHACRDDAPLVTSLTQCVGVSARWHQSESRFSLGALVVRARGRRPLTSFLRARGRRGRRAPGGR